MRKESDFLGAMEIPDEAYWGVFTKRAMENFNLTGITARPVFIHSIAHVKLAAAEANEQLGTLPHDKADAIKKAAREVIEGKHDKQFPLDVIQAGAGTPFNMNVNEVIANRALEIAGRSRGDYSFIHPNNHVNMAQSSNDVIPTAIRLAILFSHPALVKEVGLLEETLRKKAVDFTGIVKTGRTHLQDAVPIALSDVFIAYARSIEHDKLLLLPASERVSELGIGGTAIGTGINTHPDFRALVVERLAANTGLPVRGGVSLIELTSNMNAFHLYSSALSVLATSIHRISNDLKLLSSGPRGGIGELRLPEVEPGSSIMPGKINPSIPEAAEMAALQAISQINAVEAGCRGGQLQLNVLTPLIAHNLLSAQSLLANTCHMLRVFCIDGIKPDKARINNNLMAGLMVATSLAPKLGYTLVSEMIKEADRRGISVRQVVLEKKLLPESELDALLDPHRLTKPG
jgi:aspartate ammonia-lyase